METTIDFNVSQRIGKWLISRNAALDLLDQTKRVHQQNQQLTKNLYIKINFTGVNFISRSFADQFMKELDNCNNSNVILVNPSKNIIRLLYNLSQNSNYQRNLSPKIYPHFNVKDKKEFFEKLGVE